MRILHLTSDWKWTGPAEPMLRLGVGQRAKGHDVALACPVPPAPGSRSVAEEARALGLAPMLEVSNGRGVGVFSDRADIEALSGSLRDRSIDVVHTWHTRDHVIAVRAAARLGRDRPAVVRSYRSAERISRAPWSRWLFGARTDGLLCVSPETARWNAGLRGGRPIRGAFGAVDLDRFRPDAPAADARVRSETRAALGLRGGDAVVGIVARAQPHRRFDLLIDAAARLLARRPEARLLVVGRGTRREALAERPARELGIADRVIFAGYRNTDYAAVLHAMDLFTFLVPGSDGTCRALLEAAASGIPAVVTRRGALPEIVVDGETGVLVDEQPDALAEAWDAVLGDADRRRRMGAAARARATRCFGAACFADAVEALYVDALDAAHRRRA